MTGMYSMEWYWWLSEKDPQKFEQRLTKWAQKRENNEIMFFDKNTIKTGKTSKVEGTESLYVLELPNICVEYINFYGQMCILSKIIAKDNQNGDTIIYKMPEQWGGSVPWYAG